MNEKNLTLKQTGETVSYIFNTSCLTFIFALSTLLIVTPLYSEENRILAQLLIGFGALRYFSALLGHAIWEYPTQPTFTQLCFGRHWGITIITSLLLAGGYFAPTFVQAYFGIAGNEIISFFTISACVLLGTTMIASIASHQRLFAIFNPISWFKTWRHCHFYVIEPVIVLGLAMVSFELLLPPLYTVLSPAAAWFTAFIGFGIVMSLVIVDWAQRLKEVPRPLRLVKTKNESLGILQSIKGFFLTPISLPSFSIKLPSLSFASFSSSKHSSTYSLSKKPNKKQKKAQKFTEQAIVSQKSKKQPTARKTASQPVTQQQSSVKAQSASQKTQQPKQQSTAPQHGQRAAISQQPSTSLSNQKQSAPTRKGSKTSRPDATSPISHKQASEQTVHDSHTVKKIVENSPIPPHKNMPFTEQILFLAEHYEKSGDRKKALATLRYGVSELPDNVTLLKELVEVAIKVGAKKEVNLYGQLAIGQLVKQRQIAAALNFYQFIIAKTPAFELKNPKIIRQLSEASLQAQKWALVIRLAEKLHTKTGHHDDIAWCYFWLAQAFHAQDDKPKAKSILDYVLAHYPDHPVINAVKSFWKQIKRDNQNSDQQKSA